MEKKLKMESTKPRFASILVTCIFIAVLLLIPLKVISYGYIPVDDAQRHAAKAVSGKSWNEILVLRPDIKMDSHAGWHALLEFVYKTTGCSIDDLIIFSVVFLFIFFCLVPIFFLERPEAWLITLLVTVIANSSLLMRLFLGRPYIFTMAVVVILGFIWPRFREKSIPWSSMTVLTILLALATWIHCLWYMFALPVLCFFIARERRAGFLVGICTILGITIGMLLTGHPILFFHQTLSHMIHSLRDHTLSRMLVTEFQPGGSDSLMVIAVFGMLAWRAMRNSWNIKVIYTPIFILALLNWVLGFVVRRFWIDWGIPAICVWMALEFEDFLRNSTDPLSLRRVWLTLAVAGTLFLSITSDYGGRWTQNLTAEYLSVDDPEHVKWLPEKGGIIYSNDMTIFYQTFYKNPHANWRYILGFEPTMMPPDDLTILRKIQWNYGADEAFKPWVKKMRLEDRLILRRPSNSTPKIPELEWHYTATDIWIGRLPLKNTSR